MRVPTTASPGTSVQAPCVPRPPPASSPPVSLRFSQVKQARLRRILKQETSGSELHEQQSEEVEKGLTAVQPVEKDYDTTKSWHSAMKQVLLGGRIMRAVHDDGNVKDCNLTYSPELKIPTSTGATIDSDKDTVAKHCLAVLDVVEQFQHAAPERRLDPRVQNHGVVALAAQPNKSVNDIGALASPEQCALVFGLFQSIGAVNDLDSIFKAQLLPGLQVLRLSAGDTVFEQWDFQCMLYAIVRGSVEARSIKAGVPFRIGKFGPGEVIGSVSSEVCQMTATCTDDSILIGLDGMRLKAIASISTNAERVAKKAFLRDIPVMSVLSDSDVNIIEKLFTICTLSENQVLCREGTRADHLYVVKRGFFRLLKAFLPNDTPFAGDGDKDTVSSESLQYAGGRRLMHFDLGEIGAKEMLGESGLFYQAGAFSGATGTRGGATDPSESTGGCETAPCPPHSSARAITSNSTETSRETQANHNATPIFKTALATKVRGPLLTTSLASPICATSGVGASVNLTARLPPSRPRQQRKGFHIASVVASTGDSQVYTASISDMKRLLKDSPSFRRFCEIARRVHEARVSGWDAQALAEQLRNQREWEKYKREVVLKTLRLNRLEHIVRPRVIGCRVHGDVIDT